MRSLSSQPALHQPFLVSLGEGLCPPRSMPRGRGGTPGAVGRPRRAPWPGSAALALITPTPVPKRAFPAAWPGLKLGKRLGNCFVCAVLGCLSACREGSLMGPAWQHRTAETLGVL